MELFILSCNKLVYIVIILAVGCIGNTKASSNDASKQQEIDNKTSVVTMAQKTVKKELKVKLAEQAIDETTPQENDDHTKKTIKDEKALVGNTVKGLLQQTDQKSGEKPNTLETVTESITLKPQLNQHFLDVLKDEDDISESLKTGFYFFLILSSGAIVFIVFKIYRLRLSRAERKYGVQGDRSSQELTPLPISIEDGHSDDEDQTIFEIQRQNIRIL